MENVDVREFTRADGAALRAFWESCGIKIRPGDDDDALASFGSRNPGLFLLAIDARGIAASALGGWDGRRGWLYHVAVRADQRRHGLGARLVKTIEERLRARGCPKVNLLVRSANAEAIAFYQRLGYARDDVVALGKRLIPD
jgi:ribosomal protein S18 acetylase RimI-like enzyme